MSFQIKKVHVHPIDSDTNPDLLAFVRIEIEGGLFLSELEFHLVPDSDDKVFLMYPTTERKGKSFQYYYPNSSEARAKLLLATEAEYFRVIEGGDEK
jgi:DNA-binding cell septation regulator SpoVG